MGGEAMIGVVVAAHDALAAGLCTAAMCIVGTLEQVAGVGLDPGESPEDFREHFSSALDTVDSGDGVIVLVDLFGGTPGNVVIRLISERPQDRVEVVTGASLPMLLEVYTQRSELDLKALAQLAVETGRTSVVLASEMFGSHGDDDGEGAVEMEQLL